MVAWMLNFEVKHKKTLAHIFGKFDFFIIQINGWIQCWPGYGCHHDPTDKQGILYHTGCIPVSFGCHCAMKIPWVGIFVESVAGFCLPWRSTTSETPTNYGGIINNSTCSTIHGKGIAGKIGTGYCQIIFPVYLYMFW